MDGTAVIRDDPWLEPYSDAIRGRFSHYQYLKHEITQKEGGLLQFALGYKRFGLNRVPGGIQYREWAPGARALYLTGDFNNWSKVNHPCERDQYGVWSLFLPDSSDGTPAIHHNSKVKIYMQTATGDWTYRIPAWIHRVVQTKEDPVFTGVFWNPPQPYQFKHPHPPRPADLRIYEAHVGMSSVEPTISTYRRFREEVLPQVKELGYNAIQLMAIMEHAYYASFGYQVTAFFAISSRNGTPEELMELIDTAHGLGIVVLLDVVHSHASKNVLDGLNQFDGTDHCYFHEGPRGYHPVWDSRLFNYSHWEVLRFLLSNLRWFHDHYQFDGYRFDGVTAMLYYHRGLGAACNYEHYFGPDVDVDALAYLTLANDMLHELDRNVITVAEEVSGMATLCRPVHEGGVGFDYRLGMGIPDKWIELLKGVKDEDWSMGNIVHTLTNRRYKEWVIAYVESHDQALVGDKTVAFWLMDKEMYDFMSVLSPMTPIIARGMALHKLIRLSTFALGGEGYLTFMGNEFGHPEWVDFPREGNNNSYHHARRRWDLARDPLLRYQHLRNFDKAMMHLEEKYCWLISGQFVQCKHEGDKIIAFERPVGILLFIFNFHHEKSFTDYRIGVSHPGKYMIVLNSDRPEFGGFDRIKEDSSFFTEPIPWHDLPHSLRVYIPSRVGLVLALEPEVQAT